MRAPKGSGNSPKMQSSQLGFNVLHFFGCSSRGQFTGSNDCAFVSRTVGANFAVQLNAVSG